MNYLLDTNICIYFLKGKFGLKEKFLEKGFTNLFISEITVAELKYGVEKSAFPDRNQKVVNDFIEKIKQLPINNALDEYARQKARLKKDGISIDDFDLLIGSTAIVKEAILVTNNEKHFNRLQNIRIENWTIS